MRVQQIKITKQRFLLNPHDLIKELLVTLLVAMILVQLLLVIKLGHLFSRFIIRVILNNRLLGQVALHTQYFFYQLGAV
jgi:hypothetical protein